jgi:hypothetical protein
LERPNGKSATSAPTDLKLDAELKQRLQKERLRGNAPAQEESSSSGGLIAAGLEALKTGAESLERGIGLAEKMQPLLAGAAAGEDLADGAADGRVGPFSNPRLNAAAEWLHGPLGAISALGSMKQVTDGVVELAVGDTKAGIKDTAVGGLGLGSTAAEFGLLTGGATLAAPLAGAAAIVDGGFQIAEGIEKDDGVKTSIGGLKAAGGAILGASPFVGGTVLGAPVAAVMALGGLGLLGAGFVWDQFAD